MNLLAIVQSADFQSHLLSFLITAALAALAGRLRPAVRLIWGTSHGFIFTVPQNNNPGAPLTLYTRTFYVQNLGRESATDLEVHFSSKPEHFQIWPTFTYTAAPNPEGHYSVRFANLGPREWLSIEALSANHQLPMLLRVRSRSGEGKEVQIAPRRIFPNWFNYSVVGLMLLGVWWIFYELIGLVWR